jgi:outer membrane cobalamin receptor
VHAQISESPGQSIIEVIEALRDQGVRIVYSRDLLPARLRVREAPDTSDPFDALKQILAPHGLDVEIGPRETWLIVRRGPLNAPADAVSSEQPLSLIPPTLETIIVTASRYPIERQTSVSSDSFGRHAIETTPTLGQDPLRMTHRLPGITSNQLTSRMHIRGGSLDEVLLTLDGVRLFSPYHLKDFQNVFSSINSRIIESMDVRTGGYEAQYGDRMSGVIEMETIRPTDYRHHELGISLLETSVLSSGLFGQGRGSWLTSLRRGNLDLVADRGDSNIGTPQYVDFFNKVDFSISPTLNIETGILSLDDKISLTDSNKANATAGYDDTYYWVSLDQSTEAGLEATYRFSIAALDRSRSGEIDETEKVAASLSEQSEFERLSFSADWSYPLADALRLTWGTEFASMDLNHRLKTAQEILLPVVAPELSGPSNAPASALVKLTQSKRALYTSLRHQPIPRLVTEFGVRWDQQSLTDERQFSPRMNLLFDITDRTSIRAAWGDFSQSDTLNEIAVADGMSTLQPAKESRHFILGLEQLFGETGLFRMEIYEKDSDRLNVRYENLFEKVSLLPELLPDRYVLMPTSARTRGVEISVTGGGSRVSWWANLALSRTRERLPTGSFRRSWDERRSMKAGGEWTGQLWNVTASLAHRSGWPISSIRFTGAEVVAANFNIARLSDFSSVDVRTSRTLETNRGQLDWFFEISNLLDHANDCCIEYELSSAVSGTPVELIATPDELLGIVPNVGIRWQF